MDDDLVGRCSDCDEDSRSRLRDASMSAFRNCTWHFFFSRSVFLDERRMPWSGRVGVVGVVGVLGILGVVGVEGREDWVEEEGRCLDRRSRSKLLASESSESVDKKRPSSSNVNL